MIANDSKSYPVTACAQRHDVAPGLMCTFAWALRRQADGRTKPPEELNPHERQAIASIWALGADVYGQIIVELRADGVPV